MKRITAPKSPPLLVLVAGNRSYNFFTTARNQEMQVRRFKSPRQAQRFLSTHAAVYNLFNLGRHLVSAIHYRMLRQGAMLSWRQATAV